MNLRIVLSISALLAAASPAAAQEVEMRIIYDNISARPEMQADWGFSVVVKFRGSTILFDAGADSEVFQHNIEAAGVDPAEITHAVISHRHSDHREGLYGLGLKHRAMEVFFLDSFPEEAFDVAHGVGLRPHRVTGPQEIAPGVYTTGEVDGSPPEQALVLETSKGLVVLIGSSHSGAPRMVEAALQQRGPQEVRLLLGGFYLERLEEEEILERIVQLRQLGVRKVCPAHRTGETAKHLFRKEWGADYLPAGAGRVIILE
jgi:7,8-dihydropterin-6-yl-methyl-4-(beta-D-ribofuranosyl)aminobenzene 5'-phosphate synthase